MSINISQPSSQTQKNISTTNTDIQDNLEDINEYEQSMYHITQFYKLKLRYDDAINAQKKNILKNTSLSKKDKQRRFRQIRVPCINCNKDGGTFFSDENRTLRAVCGNTQSPCNLNIEIKKGNYKDVRELNSDNNEYIESIKTLIIQTKLNYLFNFSNEEDSLDKFEKLRDYLKTASISQLQFMKKYTDVFNNKEKNTEIQKYKGELYNIIQKNKHIKKLYDLEKKEQLLTEISENYLNTITFLLNKIASLEFSTRLIHQDKNDLHHYVSEPYTIQQLEFIIPGGKPTEVVNFIL